MTFAHFLTAYVNVNMLVIAGYFCLALYPLLAGLFNKTTGAQTLLKMHYGVLFMLFIIVLLYPVLPENNNPDSPVRIMTAGHAAADINAYSPSYDSGYFELPGNRKTGVFNTGTVIYLMTGFIAVILICGLIKISTDVRRLFKIKQMSYLIRKCRNISIYANDEIKIPFSYWLPGKACIIVPTGLAAKKSDLKITIYHELQHHRNGDTKWLYFIWLLRSLCILNPCVHLWSRLISELQEFACDEVLVDRKNIDSQEYASCLFEAARSASDCIRVPVCAAGLTFMVQRQLLKRRIEKMFNNMHNPPGRKLNFTVFILIMGLMVSISCVSRGMVTDHRITMEQAQVLAENAETGSEIPVVVNDLVLKELNDFMGTAEGRIFIKDSLGRMEFFRKDIEGKIKQYGVPDEFMAIPLIESGYSRMQKSRSGAAGLWQFIESTAEKFGLKKDEQTDERLDTDLSTDAAMRYLLESRDSLGDWQLAVLAYNMGEPGVRAAIEKAGSRDVWDLIRAGHENNKGYYAKFMAAVIIIKNPEYVSRQLGEYTESAAVTDKDIKLEQPVKGWISSRFGYRTSPLSGKKEFHKGLDIAAKMGTPIFAADSGII